MSTSVPAQDAAQLEGQARLALGLGHATVVPLAFDEAPDGHALASFQLDGLPVMMVLSQHDARAEGFRVLSQAADGSWTEHDPGPVRTYRGELLGAPQNVVAASWLDDGIHARIRFGDGDELWMQPLAPHVPDADALDHVLYRTVDILPRAASCGRELLPDARPAGFDFAGGPTHGVSGISTAELACDADFEYYQDWGSVANVQNRIESIVSTVNLQYESEVGITHELTTILVRTSSSQPYTSTDAVTLLNQFRNEWNANQGSVQRDLAELFTGKELNSSTIGIAWVGVVCNLSYAYNLVQSDFDGNFGCATDLTAHECGHNWNADHCNCTSNTMNPWITCANTFHPSLTIPEIVAFRDSRNCLEDGGGGGGPCTPTASSVSSITVTTVNVGQGNKRGQAVVTIVDDCGAPVAGAQVTGNFSGDLNEQVSGTTGSNGSVTLTTNSTKKGRCNITFCVSSVTSSPAYDSSGNLETCDSN